MRVKVWTDLLILAVYGKSLNDLDLEGVCMDVPLGEAKHRYHRRKREGGMNPSCVNDVDIRNFRRWQLSSSRIRH